jgi:hemolysin activation/secretion protein
LVGDPGLSKNELNRQFVVQSYAIRGYPILSNVPASFFSKYTGTNVSLEGLIAAASELQAEYRDRGYPKASVAFAWEEITNGIVTFNVAQATIPQIVVSGQRWLVQTNPPSMAVSGPGGSTTNRVTKLEPAQAGPATPEQMAHVQSAVQEAIAKLNDTRVHVVSTNSGPRFTVEKYLVTGNSVLPPKTITQVLTNIDGAFGTNVSIEGVRTVAEQLQQSYRERGYVTVGVGIPQQKLANDTVEVQVTEGRVADIDLVWIGHHYFSSNNVMRALPGLHTNIVINAPIFNAELNRANANQDRQLYPLIEPGPVPGTSELTLQVKDRLPLHLKMELDNQNSPGTPELRLNSSVVYENLWQLEHSFGLQYSFSPEAYKAGGQWDFYDKPTVVNYSVFYRLPLGSPQAIENVVANDSTSFGFNEATRKFNLPPPTGRPDFTLFASRSVIDTGTATTLSESITTNGSNPAISRRDVVHSPTENQDIGGHFNLPWPASGDLQSSFSGGLDFKTYQISNYKTNFFFIAQTNFDSSGNPLPPVLGKVPTVLPITVSHVKYLPFSLHYDGSERDANGTTTFGLGISVNTWYHSQFSTTAGDTNGVFHTTTLNGKSAFQKVAGSSQSSGHWVVLNPRISRQIVKNGWITSMLAEGQWASEPLISPEQFGAGGVNSVRGYHEGEVFGDDGWHLSLEEQTPPYTMGMVREGAPLVVSGSIYVGCAEIYLIDPQGRKPTTGLAGTGFGFTAAVGSHWQSQFLFSWPLLSAGTTPAYQPFFNFSLTAQF